MSVRTDRNFKSYDGVQENVSDVTLDPVAQGWGVFVDGKFVKPDWSDTCKFWKRNKLKFENFVIIRGGLEDVVDINNDCVGNTFSKFVIMQAGDTYVLTLKGDTSNNTLEDWLIYGKGGKTVDIEIGNWSSYNFGRCTGNKFINWRREDGEPIRYAYRIGCKPTFVRTNTKHIWWLSIGLTFYWWFKFVKHRVFKIADK